MGAPEWLAELLAEHAFVPDCRGSATGNCAKCHPHGSIGRMGTTVHRAHVADIVWQAFTERVGLEIKESIDLSLKHTADGVLRAQAEYRLKSLPEVDEMCPNCVTPWKCNGPHEYDTPHTTAPSDTGPNTH